jgi:heme-degrading monooxygenase HmoA
MASSRLARTPAPPYYAVITTAQTSERHEPAVYRELGLELHRLAKQIDGFLGLEAFPEDTATIAVSYWSSLEAIEAWQRHPLHREAKRRAKERWFGPTITRIARVERAYGFNLSPDGPAASESIREENR